MPQTMPVPTRTIHSRPHSQAKVQILVRSSLRSSTGSSANRRRAQDLVWSWVGTKWPRLGVSMDERGLPQLERTAPGVQLSVSTNRESNTWTLSVANSERDGTRTWMTSAMVTAQVAGRPVGVLLGADTALNPFSIRPSYQPLLALPIAERMARLRDPAMRAEILADRPSEALMKPLSQFRQHIVRRWHRMFKLGNPPDYEPPASASIAAIAEREGRTPDEVAYDYLAADPTNFIFFPVTGYNVDNHDVIREMLTSEETVLGLSDGGAHCSSILDAGMPTWMITHWARDRHRGPRLPLELIVKRQTSETAGFFGLHDRGVLAPGKKADVNIIDYAGLQVQKPEIVYDLPAGGRRLVQKVDGYKATFVSGIPVFENGEHTGALPGQLVRAGR